MNNAANTAPVINCRGFEAGDVVTVYGTYTAVIISVSFGGMRVRCTDKKEFNTSNEFVHLKAVSHIEAELITAECKGY
jgi:hypothetical protein